MLRICCLLRAAGFAKMNSMLRGVLCLLLVPHFALAGRAYEFAFHALTPPTATKPKSKPCCCHAGASCCGAGCECCKEQDDEPTEKTPPDHRRGPTIGCPCAKPVGVSGAVVVWSIDRSSAPTFVLPNERHAVPSTAYTSCGHDVPDPPPPRN